MSPLVNDPVPRFRLQNFRAEFVTHDQSLLASYTKGSPVFFDFNHL